MDGELSSEAGRFLARRMGSEEALGATWQRYHLIRDCMRRPGESFALTRLSIDLEQLDLEDEAPPAPRGLPRWLRPVAGTAIAASVAAAALLVTLNLDNGPAAVSPEPFASPNAPSPLRMAESQPASYQAGSAANQRSLNRYILRHNQAAVAVGQHGFVSFIPSVATAPMQVIEPAVGPVQVDEAPADGDDSQP